MTTLESLLNDPGALGTWLLAPDRSTVGFRIKNMWGLLAVNGRFTEFSGEGRLEDANTVAGRLDVQVASLSTGISRRDQHLLSADFFDVERFPQISVAVTALQPTTARGGDLRASFTIKGNTEPVPLPVTVAALDDGAVQIWGETKVERSEFGLGWNKFGMVGDTATVTAELVFVRAQ